MGEIGFGISILCSYCIASGLSVVTPYYISEPIVRFLRHDGSADGVPNLPPSTTTTTEVPPPTLSIPPKIPDCSGTCEYRNTVASQTLVSCDGACVCANRPNGMIDGSSSWDVIWNGTICTISESGPCGRGDGGMIMACEPGLNCIEKRCREPSRVGSIELGWACDDSLDCQHGLACVSDEHVRPIHKTCRILPKSLFRIW